MKWLLLLLLAPRAFADAPAPFYNRATTANQDLGGLDGNFRDVTGRNRDALVPIVGDQSCTAGQALLGATEKGGYIYGGTCVTVTGQSAGAAFLNSTQTFTGANTFTSTTVFSGPISGNINIATQTVIPQSSPATKLVYADCLAGSTITIQMPFTAYVEIAGIIATVDGGSGDYEGVGFLMDGAYLETGAHAIAFESTGSGGGNIHTLYPYYVTAAKVAGGAHAFCLTYVSNDGGTTRFGDIGSTGYSYSWYRVSTKF